MIERISYNCCGCGACAGSCPKACIEMRANGEGFLYPVVDEDRCSHCGLCEKVCPVLNTQSLRKWERAEAWGTTARDEALVKKSSSGGVFSLLALAVLRNNGVVYGAAFEDQFQTVKHIRIDDESNLEKLRGSKYLQSDISDCYVKAREDLRNGREVLFSGTPCQIAGLRGFLRIEYEKLLCVDVACHGCPSPLLWKKYIAYVVENNKVEEVCFRDKRTGWRQYGLCVGYADGEYYDRMDANPYMHMFLHNLCLRESCYHCAVKEAGSAADITIGDFWGVEAVAKNLDNDQGVSLVLIHTDRGQGYWNAISQDVICHRVDFDGAVQGNSAINHSVMRPEKRNCFFVDLQSISMKSMIRKYNSMDRFRKRLSESLLWRAARRIRRLMNSLID